jgi:hypothetical protein
MGIAVASVRSCYLRWHLACLARRKVLKGNKTLLQHGHRRCKREKLLPALASGMACANNEGM